MKWQSSDVDWCEDNYAVSRYTVEFWNTISNLPLIVIPCTWLVLNREYTRIISKDMLANSITMILTGLCSAFFHATLSFAGQLLDEWAILWATMTAIALWIPKSYFPTCCEGSRKEFNKLVLVITVVCTALGYIFPYINMFALLIFGAFLWIPFLEVLRRTNSIVEFRMRRRSFRMIWLAVFVWCLDKYACSWWWGMKFAHLHSIWHVTMVCSLYSAAILVALIRSNEKIPEYEMRLEFWPPWTGELGIPCITVHRTRQMNYNRSICV